MNDPIFTTFHTIPHFVDSNSAMKRTNTAPDDTFSSPSWLIDNTYQLEEDPLLLIAPRSPNEDVEQGKQEIEAGLSSSLQQLNLQERERALDDLHGISNNSCSTDDQSFDPEEDPLFQKQSLAAMEERLNQIKHGKAIELAEKLDFAYVNDPDMRIMFLRSCDFDPIRAADKMLGFFEVKRECFGVQKLTQDITLEDLTQEEKEEIKSGYMQVLPFQDMSGREIIMIQATRKTGCSHKAEDRAKFFMINEYAKKANERRTKFTMVYFGLDAPNREVSRFVGLWFAVPIRVAGIHICNNSSQELVRDCYGIVKLPARSLARTRVHIGTYAQVHASLSAYGIPSHLVPARFAESPTLSHHLEWYKQLEASSKKAVMEQASSVPSALPLARSASGGSAGQYTEKDVLFGHKRNHTGNAFMRKLVEMHQETYDVSPKAGKVKLAREIVEQIQKAGGRFLRRDEEGDWVEVSNDKARDKVAHTFRNLRRCH